VWAGGIVTIVVIGEVYKGRPDRGLAVDERAATLRTTVATGEATAVSTRGSSRHQALRFEKGGREGNPRPMIGALPHCIATEYGAPCVVAAAPRHSSEKRWVGECCFVFIVLHFPIFSCSKSSFHHWIVGASFHAFFFMRFHSNPSLIIIIKKMTNSALEAWVRRAKKIHWIWHLGRRFSAFDLFLTSLFSSQCTRETRREGKAVVGIVFLVLELGWVIFSST
jgi:hypothetical protein